jgi:pyruvate kinase
MTKIVTTIGPASEDREVLEFFREHSVNIARLNFSHNSPDWHIDTGRKCRELGFTLMADLAGPKILFGHLAVEKTFVESGEVIGIEKQNLRHEYPYKDQSRQVLPCQFHIEEFAKEGQPVLIDDGKVQAEVLEVVGSKVFCLVRHGGPIKSNKAINMPLSSIDIDFLVERDREFLAKVLPAIQPEYVAPSFVKTKEDLDKLKHFLRMILNDHQIAGYFPKICTKVEMGEAVIPENLVEIVRESDMIMIARGDLALETLPNHIKVPFYQEQMKRLCRAQGKPFIVATQILETMADNPVPTRAEMSDLYRAVVLDQADYVMLSGESAAGQFPEKCVELMHQMITQAEEFKQEVLGSVD